MNFQTLGGFRCITTRSSFKIWLLQRMQIFIEAHFQPVSSTHNHNWTRFWRVVSQQLGASHYLHGLAPHTFAYLNNATLVDLARYDVHSHTDFAAFMAEIGPLPKSDMEKKSDICKSYGRPHLVRAGVCWTNVLISRCEVGTVWTHLQKEFLKAKPEQIWAHMHMVAQSINRMSKGEANRPTKKTVKTRQLEVFRSLYPPWN